MPIGFAMQWYWRRHWCLGCLGSWEKHVIEAHEENRSMIVSLTKEELGER